MKDVKKSNVSTNALKVKSIAGDKLGVAMYAFRKQDIDTLREDKIVAIQYTDQHGTMRQTEDIVIKGSIPRFESYGSLLAMAVTSSDGKRSTCSRDLTQFLRRSSHELPVRHYYSDGYGWKRDGATGTVRFDGSSIVGLSNTTLDNDHEYHLKQNGDPTLTTEACNSLMRGRIKSQFLVASSIASPIFGALSLDSLVINVCGESSQGKSTVLDTCISLWGKPEDEKLSATWHGTRNNICSGPKDSHGVPFLIDDTSLGKDLDFANIVYVLAEGKSKGRLNASYTPEATFQWHTVVLSSSEIPMLDRLHTVNKGIFRRLIEMNVVNGDLLANEREANLISGIIKENYGHIGTQFVEAMFQQGLTANGFERLSDLLAVERDRLQQSVDSIGVAKGLAEKLAIILLAAKLGKEHLGLAFDIGLLTEYTKSLIKQAQEKMQEVSIARQDVDECYRRVCEYAESKLGERFVTESDYHIPIRDFNRLEEELGYSRNELRAEFERQGFCDFSKASASINRGNTVKIRPEDGGAMLPKKVITVAKLS